MIKKILLDVTNYLFIYAIGLFLLSLIDKLNSTAIDFHLHDTYFVIAFAHILFAMAFFLVFLWILYHLLKPYFLSVTLSNIHIIGTLACVVVFIVLHFTTLDNMPRRFLDFSQWESFQQDNPTAKWYQYGTMTFIVLQLVFLINLILGTFKKIST